MRALPQYEHADPRGRRRARHHRRERDALRDCAKGEDLRRSSLARQSRRRRSREIWRGASSQDRRGRPFSATTPTSFCCRTPTTCASRSSASATACNRSMCGAPALSCSIWITIVNHDAGTDRGQGAWRRDRPGIEDWRRCSALPVSLPADAEALHHGQLQPPSGR